MGSFVALACGGIAATEGPDRRALVCEDGELRLTEETCGSGERLVEECQGEEWHPTTECRAPDDCEESAVLETDELCGDPIYFFNRRLLRCSGGLLQPAGCVCGAENPEPPEGGLGINSQEVVDLLADQSFPWGLNFPYQDVNLTGLDHVRCVNTLRIRARVPPLRGLRAASVVWLSSPDASSLDNLQETEVFNLGVSSGRLNGLHSLHTVTGRLVVVGELESLDGLENLRNIGDLLIEAKLLTSISALSSLEAIGGSLDTLEAERLEDLTGLQNVRSIGGDMEVRLTSTDQIGIFEKLESVGGDVFLRTEEELICEAGLFFSQKSIGGTLVVGPTNDRVFDPVNCE